MSLDLEDFEFALADRFGRIRSASPAYTPRTLAAQIAAERFQWPSRVSPTVRAFCRIRAALSLQLAVDPKTITPRTPVVSLMPDRQMRRAQWQRVRDTLGIRQAPRLARPRLLAWTLLFVTIAAAVIGGTFAPPPFTSPFSFSGAVLSGIGVTMMSLRLTRYWARYFEPPDLTVGALAHYTVAYGSPVLGDVTIPVNTAQTLEVVQALARLEIGGDLVHPDDTREQLDIRARAS